MVTSIRVLPLTGEAVRGICNFVAGLWTDLLSPRKVTLGTDLEITLRPYEIAWLSPVS